MNLRGDCLNTGSVPMNKSIPETGKIGTKTKSNKSADSFKDMIKNVSSKTSSDQSGQAIKEGKNLKRANPKGARGNAEAERDHGVSTKDLETLIVNASVGFDPAQLTKIVNLFPEGQGDISALVTEESGATQAATLAMQGETNFTGVQMGSALDEMARVKVPEGASFVYAGQAVTEDENNGTSPSFLKQDTAASVIENALPEETGVKQNVSLKEQNSGAAFFQENEGADSSVIAGNELQLLSSDNGSDNVITIKVGEPSLISSWKQVSDEIGNMIVEKINNEVQKINIKLTPKELGEIDVEFLIDHGKISVSLQCSNEGTKALLATNLDSLSKVVQSSLMQDVNVNLNNYDKAQEQSAGSENFDGSGNNGQYQEDSNHKRKEQEQPNLDFAQKLRLGIESVEGGEA